MHPNLQGSVPSKGFYKGFRVYRVSCRGLTDIEEVSLGSMLILIPIILECPRGSSSSDGSGV